jgi:UrcA family protein
MSEHNRRWTRYGALALLSLISTAHAQEKPLAQDSSDVARRTVRYADLDLTQEIGRRQLRTRIRQAANLACQNYSTSFREIFQICVTQSTDAALARVGVPAR